MKIPSPALVLVGAAVAVKVVPALHAPPYLVVERVVTVALVCILFDGGMQIGWSRFRSAAVPVTVTGVAGTFLTVAACALLAHAGFGLSWYASVLLARALAPTDPAVVFSVLGQREVSGRSDVILKGESAGSVPVTVPRAGRLRPAGARRPATATARPLTPQETAAALTAYARRHPRAWAALKPVFETTLGARIDNDGTSLPLIALDLADSRQARRA